MHLLSADHKSKRISVGERLVTAPINVLQIGAGGTGSEMFDALVRLHFTLVALGHPGLRLHLQDGDTVSPFNIGRQRFTPSDQGCNKALTLARRYGLIYGIDITPHTSYATKRSYNEFSGFDLLVTCVDRATVRTAIADHWRNRRADTIWIDSGNGSASGQVVIGHLSGKDPANRIPHVLDLFPSIRTTPDDDRPSCSMREALRSQTLFVNRWMADIAGTMLYRLLTEGHIGQIGAIADLSALEVRPIAVDRDIWAFLSGAPSPRVAAPRGARPRRKAA